MLACCAVITRDVFVALTSKWCRRQSRQHLQMRGSRGAKGTGTTSDWPSRAFEEPDSWARRRSGGKNSGVLDLFLLISARVICFTHFFQVKEHNQLHYLNCRQKWCKQHPEPGQKTDRVLLPFRYESGFLGCAAEFRATTKWEFVHIWAPARSGRYRTRASSSASAVDWKRVWREELSSQPMSIKWSSLKLHSEAITCLHRNSPKNVWSAVKTKSTRRRR